MWTCIGLPWQRRKGLRKLKLRGFGKAQNWWYVNITVMKICSGMFLPKSLMPNQKANPQAVFGKKWPFKAP